MGSVESPLPWRPGEKVTMGITTLLSMTVFLMLVAENMPATSDVLPLVGTRTSTQLNDLFSTTVLLTETRILTKHIGFR